MRVKTIVGARRRRPHIHRSRGLITTFAHDGLCLSRGNVASGELVVESDALRWRRGTCG